MILRNAGYDVSKKSQLEKDIEKDLAKAPAVIQNSANNLVAYGGMYHFYDLKTLLMLNNGDPSGSLTGNMVSPFITTA